MSFEVQCSPQNLQKFRIKIKQMRFHLLLFILFSCNLLVAQKDWQLKKNTNGIKVYYRAAANSDINELKIVTTMDVSIDAAEALLTDAKQHPNWIYSCTETQI